MSREQFFRSWAILATIAAVVFFNTTLFFAYRAHKNDGAKAMAARAADPQAPAASPSNSLSVVDTERLVLAYTQLKNAERVAAGEMVLSKGGLLATGRAMSADDLKGECSTITARILATLPSLRGSRRAETFAYIKNGMLRLTFDREENHAAHVRWAIRNNDQAADAIRECAEKIQEALTRM